MLESRLTTEAAIDISGSHSPLGSRRRRTGDRWSTESSTDRQREMNAKMFALQLVIGLLTLAAVDNYAAASQRETISSKGGHTALASRSAAPGDGAPFNDGRPQLDNRFARDIIERAVVASVGNSSTETQAKKLNEHSVLPANGSRASAQAPFGGSPILAIQATAIYVERAEFPLGKLLFKLTLKLALSEASRFLDKALAEQQQLPGRNSSSGSGSVNGSLSFDSRNQSRHGLQHRQQWRQPRQVKLSLSVRSANTCSRQYAAALAAEEFYVRRSRLFIVSGCDDAIRSVSRLASRWQVPVMTAAGFGADLSDKRVHKTLVRVAFSLRAAVEFLFKLLKSFQWRRINLVVDESDANSRALRGSIEQHALRAAAAAASQTNRSSSASEEQFHVSINTISFDLQLLLRNNEEILSGNGGSNDNDSVESAATANATHVNKGGRVSHAEDPGEEVDDKWPNELTEKAIQDCLWQCATYSRVTILLIPQEFIRKFLLSAQERGMANGLYTFINMPLLQAAPPATAAETTTAAAAASGDQPAAAAARAGKQQSGYVTALSNAAGAATGENLAFIWRAARSRRNAQAKRAFESLMSIYLRTPTTKAYVYFASKLNNLAANSPATRPRKQRTAAAANPLPVAPLARANASYLGGDKSAIGLGQPAPALQATRARLQLNINPYSASFYDGLQIYAMALNESLSLVGSRPANFKNGIGDDLDEERDLHGRVSELVRNRRFDAMVTGNIYINANGDRETDYTLDDMNQMTGKFAPVIWYRGETRDIERLGRIHWSSDSAVGPTSDLVDCALLGTCVGKPISRFTFVLILLAAPLASILSGLFYFVHNKLSLESQLVDHWWKIHLSDIEIVLTRRKNANDGSLVSNQDQTSSVVADGDGDGNNTGRDRLAVGQSGRRRSHAGSVIGLGGLSGAACDKTEITRATDTSAGWASSAMDACYGNITLGLYKLSKVALKPIGKFHQSRKLMIELRGLKEINHSNLCRFIGILVDEGSLAIVSEFCPKGSLREFFHNESMVVDWTFKYSIINDIMAGLTYLHTSPLAFHGRLKSSNCLVSARFVVKLSDYGPHSLYEQLDAIDESDHDKRLDRLKGRVWLAPEHMKSSSSSPSAVSSSSSSSSFSRFGSMRGDVYSLGLLLYEVVTNCLPFFDQQRDDYVLPLEDLCQRLKKEGAAALMAPSVAALLEAESATAQTLAGCEKQTAETGGAPPTNIKPLVELMETCWRYEPAKRPTLSAVNGALKRITRGVTSKKLLENLTSRMEQYTNNLESLVEAKLAVLVEEKQRSEELLYQFVPKSIASLLKEGQFVEPEAFDCVTVFYSDIVGFTSLSSESSPMEVVDFLSDLYLCFDATLEQHDIFKVDTIGDAYIVASGLPQRNEGKHVVEIARAALELRDRLKSFKIPHKPDRSLEMRVGIHSGPCIAGIVGGLNMPKYCVFGDTLTTGKFMESSGLPMRIHVTEESRCLLANSLDFTIEPRLPKITRDGLPFQTYWLESTASATSAATNSA